MFTFIISCQLILNNTVHFLALVFLFFLDRIALKINWDNLTCTSIYNYLGFSLRMRQLACMNNTKGNQKWGENYPNFMLLHSYPVTFSASLPVSQLSGRKGMSRKPFSDNFAEITRVRGLLTFQIQFTLKTILFSQTDSQKYPNHSINQVL